MIRSHLLPLVALSACIVAPPLAAAEEKPEQAAAISAEAFAKLEAEVARLRKEITALQKQLAGKAASARKLTAGDGLQGGGDLSQDRTLSVTHDDSLTVSEGELGVAAGSFAAAKHHHDDRYTTDKEIRQGLSKKADNDHDHDDRYPTDKEMTTAITAENEVLAEKIAAAEKAATKDDEALAGKITAAEKAAAKGDEVLAEKIAAAEKAAAKDDEALAEKIAAAEKTADDSDAELQKAIATKADADHLHDQRYPTIKAMEKGLAGRVPLGRTIAAGTGLGGGGDLDEDLTLSVLFDGKTLITDEQGRLLVDASLFAAAGHAHDKRYYTRKQVDDLRALLVPRSRKLIAGAGLSGGGDLNADRTVTVVTDEKTVTVAESGLAVKNKVFAAYGHQHDTRYMTRKESTEALDDKVPLARSLRAGAGLAGGGDLSEDRELAVAVDDKTLAIRGGKVQLNTRGAETGQVPVVAADGGLAWQAQGNFTTVDLRTGDYAITAHDRIVFVLAKGNHLRLPPAAAYPVGRILLLNSHDFVRVFCAAGETILFTGDGRLYERDQTCVGQGRPFSRIQVIRLISDGTRWYQLGK